MFRVIAAGVGLVLLAGCSSMPSSPMPAADMSASAGPAGGGGAGARGAAAAAPGDGPGVLESGREQLRAGTVWVASEVNDWFGDIPFENGGTVTHGRLGIRALWREDEDLRFNVRLRARLQLPNLREKAYVFFGQDNEREVVTDQPEAFSREQQLLTQDLREDQTLFAGIGVMLRDAFDLRVGVRGGYKLYTQARYRKEWLLSFQDRVEFRETLFWSLSERFGSTTSLDYEHAWSPTLSLRWRNSGTISQESDGFTWSTSLGAFKAFGDDRLLSLEALLTGEAGADADVGEYGLRAKWQQPVYRDWLIGEVIVGHFWPRHDGDAERDRVWAVGGGVELRF